MVLLENKNCEIGLKDIMSGSVNAVIADPPYLYLKRQKLEKKFDEDLVFSELLRILNNGGFLCLFGRGISFHRWNMKLHSFGFIFKEEVIWDKSYTTSSMHPISRHHECITLWSKGPADFQNVKIPYVEMKEKNIESICQDVKRILSALNSPKELALLLKYLETGVVAFGEPKKRGYNTTIQGVTNEQCRSVKTIQAIIEGMKEKSIIRVLRDHYSTIHPTQKPVKLMDRILNLISKPGSLILDPFAGSASVAISCINSGRSYIGFELDEEYFLLSKKRIEDAKLQKDFTLPL